MGLKKTLGKALKIAAPIAASFIPGVGPVASSLIGAGMGAGGGLLAGDSLGQTMLDAGLGAAPGVIKGLKGSGGPSTGSTGTTGTGVDESFWDKLKGNIPALLQTGGTVLAGAGAASAANRDAKLSATMDQNAQNIQAQNAFQNQLLARSAENRAGQSDAWKKLQQSSYVKNWKPSGTSFSPYTRSLVAPSEDVRAGADALMGQTRDSLMSGRYNDGGAPLAMPTNMQGTVDPSLVNPSMWEKIFNVAGPGMDVLGSLTKKKPVVSVSTARTA